MTKIFLATAVLLLFGMGIVVAQSSTTPKSGNPIIEQQTYLLHFDESPTNDTLYILSDGFEYTLLWHTNDTISQAYSYSGIGNTISNLGALGYSNTFLMQVYSGDGCPQIYRILAFEDSKNYFLSDLFGNCDAIESLKTDYQMLTIRFADNPDANRKKAHYNYDTYQHNLIQK
jgi:hypothetical protein